MRDVRLSWLISGPLSLILALRSWGSFDFCFSTAGSLLCVFVRASFDGGVLVRSYGRTSYD